MAEVTADLAAEEGQLMMDVLREWAKLAFACVFLSRRQQQQAETLKI